MWRRPLPNSGGTLRFLQPLPLAFFSEWWGLQETPPATVLVCWWTFADQIPTSRRPHARRMSRLRRYIHPLPRPICPAFAMNTQRHFPFQDDVGGLNRVSVVRIKRAGSIFPDKCASKTFLLKLLFKFRDVHLVWPLLWLAHGYCFGLLPQGELAPPVGSAELSSVFSQDGNVRIRR